MRVIWKKKMLFISVMFLLAVLVACGTEDSNQNEMNGEGINEAAETNENDEGTDENQEAENENQNEEVNENEGDTDENTAENNNASDNETTDENENTNEAVEQTSHTFTLYYSDDELMDIVTEEKEITFANTEQLIESLWAELQTPAEEQNMALWDEFELASVDVNNGTVTLDIIPGENVQFGASAEAMAIQSLLDTLAQVDEVTQVQLLINGEVAESLAGHVTIDEPLSVDEDYYGG